MSYFTYEGTISGGPLNSPTTAGRLDFGDDPTAGELVLTDNASGYRITLTLNEGALAVVDVTQAYPPNLGPMTSVVLDGQIVSLGDDDLAAVASQSESDSQTLYASRSGEEVDRIEALAVDVGGQTYLYLSSTAGDGISCYALEPDGTLTLIEHEADSTSSFADGITSMAQVDAGGQSYVIAASAGEDGLTSYLVNPDGSLTQVDAIEAGESLPINDPQALEAITVNGTQYLVVASSGSSSLSVLEVAQDGTLTPVDHIIDDLGTRFANASVMESFSVGDHSFIIAGGSDDGLSLFLVLPDGRLLHLETLVDTAETSLANVTDISVQRVDGEVQLFVVSGTEGGISQFIFDPDNLGDMVEGGTNLNGTARDDILNGGSGSNVIVGGSGNDILIDGAGSDTLVGGSGADIFVLSADGETDTITDFTLGEDSIDLSAYGMLYDISDIQITSTADGAELVFGDETLIIVSSNGLSLSAEDFTNADLINVSRVDLTPLDNDPDGDVITGTETSDSLIGDSTDQTLQGLGGDDVLQGGGGADILDGGAGTDIADYSAATSGVAAYLDDAASNTGMAAGDSYISIEGLTGSAFGDQLGGNSDDNILSGLGGNDVLTGNSGQDDLFGGDGNDTLFGNDHNDSLWGENGADTLHGGNGFDHLDGGSGADTLYGDIGNDDLFGGDGDDTLYGGDGNDALSGDSGQDTLWGDAGNDTLSGGADDDQLNGGDGGDILNGDGGNDTLNGDSGNDTMFGGTGNDTINGGVGIDEIHGDDGNDTLDGGDDDDLIYGGSGRDLIYGGFGGDYIEGGDGDDRISADNGFDVVYCGAGNDKMRGGTGDDIIFGGTGNDFLLGDDGRDQINGGAGTDRMYGGVGRDDFIFEDFEQDSYDVIHDYEIGFDEIHLDGPGSMDDLNFSNVKYKGQNFAEVEYQGHSIYLQGVSVSELSEDDFVFL